MALFNVSKKKFTAIKGWVQMIVAVSYFVYMWFITDPSSWVTSRKFEVTELRDKDGKKITDSTDKDDKDHIDTPFYANRWTEYNILRGSSLTFLLVTITHTVVDVMDYHDKIIHINDSDSDSSHQH